MNMFQKTRAKTPTEYFAMIRDEARRRELKKLHALIRVAAPTLKPSMQYSMIGYGSYHYRSVSGREGDWPVVALASQKHYISVYICMPDSTGYLPERYKKQLPKASIGKSCIRFKRISDIDLTVIRRLVKEAAVLAKKMKYQYIAE